MQNKLDYFIKEKAKTEGKLIQEIVQDISNYCNMGVDTVKAYKNKGMIPSLPVAIKLSEYFGTTVNELFVIVNYDKLMETRKHRGKTPSLTQAGCRYQECGEKVLARNLCSKHYQQWRRRKISINVAVVDCPTCNEAVVVKTNGHGRCKCGTHVKWI